ncbi:hypothetical protein B0H19DRAFT_1250502 [Mycena capillaripes]|nr:hypothetical protein B0H19DRAFT_1250502 [Mycena capillaripes]
MLRASLRSLAFRIPSHRRVRWIKEEVAAALLCVYARIRCGDVLLEHAAPLLRPKDGDGWIPCRAASRTPVCVYTPSFPSDIACRGTEAHIAHTLLSASPSPPTPFATSLFAPSPPISPVQFGVTGTLATRVVPYKKGSAFRDAFPLCGGDEMCDFQDSLILS